MTEHLSPFGWADVATKTDVEQLRERLEGRIDRLEHRFDGSLTQDFSLLRADLTKMLDQLLVQFIVIMTAFITIALALSRIG